MLLDYWQFRLFIRRWLLPKPPRFVAPHFSAFAFRFDRPKSCVHFCRCFGLHSGADVGIQVHGRCDRRVSKSLLGHFGMDTGVEELGGVGMSRVMEANARQIRKALP